MEPIDDTVGAIGMILPGYLDADRRELAFSANLPQLTDARFLAGLREASSVPMVFDSDANGAALAESRFGGGRGVDRLIVVTVGTGIGGGVVIGGRILRIWRNLAGSLGHVIVDAKGPKCRCGARGCVEAHAAGPIIEKRAAQLAEAAPESYLAGLARERASLSGVEIADALARRDPPALRAVNDAGCWLGAGIASWAVIFRPDKVLIGGGLAALGEPFLNAIRRGVTEVGQPAATDALTIDRAVLGSEAGVIGAATLAFDGDKFAT